MDAPEQNLEKMIALGRMTRALVHDFNNSLASIMGYADFLMSDLPDDSEQHLFVRNIKCAALQLQESIEQIRSFSTEGISANSAPLTPKSILLVEGKEMVLYAIATLLQHANHKVESAMDGFIALDMMRENPHKYDLLIIGDNMPDINGKEFLAEIRVDFESIPVIIMSTDLGFLQDLENDMGNQNIFILPKPVTAQNLALAIDFTHKRPE